MTDLIKHDDALLPCPFCGGEASKIPDADHSTGWAVGCFSGKCDIEPYVWAVHLETAAMQWNTRTLTAIDPAANREAALQQADQGGGGAEGRGHRLQDWPKYEPLQIAAETTRTTLAELEGQ